MLDLHPSNLLGRGVLDPDTEAALLGRGIVFAAQRTAYPARGKAFQFLLTSKRPYADILNTRTKTHATRTPHEVRA